MKTYETVSDTRPAAHPNDDSGSSTGSRRARRGARLSRRRALVLAAGLWVGLFGLELIALPPWGAQAHPAAPTHTTHLSAIIPPKHPCGALIQAGSWPMPAAAPDSASIVGASTRVVSATIVVATDQTRAYCDVLGNGLFTTP